MISEKFVPHRSNTPLSSFWKDNKYFVLDQLLLPDKIKYIECSTPEDIAETIIAMNLRGAPLIGAAASAAIALFFLKDDCHRRSFEQIYQMLLDTRPTAVNLKNVLDEAKEIYKTIIERKLNEQFAIFREFSEEVHIRDVERNYLMGENGAEYLSEYFFGKKLKIITHCNAGALATCGYGTAIGVIRSLNRRGLVEHVFIDETRPYLQGARLTAFEMVCEKIPHTLITDSTAAWIMKKEKIDFIITGADRVAANGDLANKIGTYSLAINARYHNIPFISALPLETFDLTIESGESIAIEKRSDHELLFFNEKRIAHPETRGLHLGFDVVPAGLIHSLITENGILKGNISKESIAGLFNEK